METKEQKQFYVTVNGQKVEVSEEVYRAYVRPIRAQQRAKRRNWRCIVLAEKYGLVRCKEDCNQCPYALQGNVPTGNETSLDTLCEAGFDAPSSGDIEADLIECEERVETAARVQEAIGLLNARQRYIVQAIYYDGKSKHRTIVGDNCFIGSNVNLVAPVKLGDGCFIAAGTTVTEDVPAGAFVIGRVRQESKNRNREAE